MKYEIKILIIGPPNCGKTKLANFLSDMNISLPTDFKLTEPLRILEFDLNDVEIDGNGKANIDVQLWDVNGSDKYMSYWPFYLKNVDGIIFVCSSADESEIQCLDSMYNFFVLQSNISFRACLACVLSSEKKVFHLSPQFAKISQVVVDLESRSEKFRQEFLKYAISVVSTLDNKT